MREYLVSFLNRCEYPQEATASLLCDYDRLMECEELKRIFFEYLEKYKETDTVNVGEANYFIEPIAKELGLNFRVQLLLSCALTKHMKELYDKAGYPEEVFYESVKDLRTKAIECYKKYGVWGCFVSNWFYEWYHLGRFALGRLQYEFKDLYSDLYGYSKHGAALKEGDRVLEVHIPSTGPLTEESVISSLKEAYEFFKKYFPQYINNGLMVCECCSWLLGPDLIDILGECNTVKFLKKFEILKTWEDQGYHNCWRVFYVDYDPAKVEELPEPTPMTSKIKKHLAGGGKMGEGMGILLFDGEKILTEYKRGE